jgi:ectoine hydroxylase-related dioxygenase (phytanoyl-CoA dioxygenase family)
MSATADRPHSAEQYEQFDREGYFVLERFFTADEIAAVTSNIDAKMEELQRSKPEEGSRNLPGHGMLVLDFMAEHDDELKRFCSHARLVDVLKPLIGPDIRLFYNQAIYKPSENPREFPWHQDNGYAPVKPEQYITCWIALNDATVENGCIWVQPRTHTNGTRPHVDSPLGKVGYQGDEQGIPVPVPAGSVIVFSSLLLHRSGPNLSNGVRKAYILQYFQADAKNGRTGATFSDRILVCENGCALT